MALYGRRGFASDVDLVVEGDWSYLQRYLLSLGARKNKFGGYRLTIATWPIDIWHAQETWAIKENLVRYEGIATLTKTTVLNWDAVLMNWRTRELIFRPRYFEELSERNLDVVLESNPNPLGMAVRVLRHLCQKDARGVTEKAVRYLSNAARTIDFEQIKNAEIASYGDSYIAPEMYQYFQLIDGRKDDVRQQYRLASLNLQQQIKLAG